MSRSNTRMQPRRFLQGFYRNSHLQKTPKLEFTVTLSCIQFVYPSDRKVPLNYSCGVVWCGRGGVLGATGLR